MLSVRVLGELAWEEDGGSLDLPVGRPACALLGLLALDHRPHARSELAAALWPDVLDESARGSLRSALAALRRALGPGADRYLVATRDRVGLGPEVWTDAAAFGAHVAAGRLTEAVDLWRGDLLSGLDDEWVLTARDEWRDRAGTVLTRLADQAEAAGDAAAAIAHTRRIVGLDPLAEEGQRALIRRLAQAGDRPAALAAYERYAQRLRTELRIAPSRATRAIVDAIRAAEPAESASAPGPAPEPNPGPASVTPTAAATTPAGPTETTRPAASPSPAAPASTSGTVTLLFTDLVGSTELLVELGDDEAERLRRAHFGLLRDVALVHAGQEVKSLGDGLMVAFGSSLDAVACAVGIQQAVERYNRHAGNEHLRVRVGLNVGEPIRDEDDFFGTPVVVAKRLCDRAEGGQILASELIRLLIGARGGFAFRSVGELALKGLAHPVASCEVVWEPVGADGVPLPSELARDEQPLVGREDPLAALEAAWARAGEGRLGVAAVAGEPGIGKTRLVAELCRRAHAAGATVLFGRCHEETLSPYEPFVEALRRYVEACPAAELRLHVGTRRAVLAKLVPELHPGDLPPSRGAGDVPAGDAGERFALFDAVGSFFREAARSRPILLVLDDLHWADDASLLLLRHLVRAAADVPLLIVGTHRDTEVHADDPLSEAFAQLRRARVLDTIVLAGLGAGEVATLVRGCGADLPAALLDAVAERTDGNPFFVEEIVRQLDAGGPLVVPDSVKDLLRRRLRGLPEASRRTLGAAAVLGREFDLDVLGQVAGHDADAVLEVVDDALGEHVLVDVADVVGRFAFAHTLIRETIYEDISPARRPGLHRRAGEALEQRHAASLDTHAAQLARHFDLAGEDARSLDHRLRAGRAAWRVYAVDTAIVHLSAALATAARLGLTPGEDERVRRALLERGWLRWLTGDDEAGTADYGRALEGARAGADRRVQAEALDALAYAEMQFDAERSGLHHAEALRIAEELGDVPLQIRILSRIALTRANNLDLAGAVAAAAGARDLAAGTGDDRDTAVAIDALKLTALQRGDLGQLELLTTQLEEIERRHGDLWYLQWTLLEAAFVPLARAQWAAGEAKLEEALAANSRVGDRFAGPMIQDARCWLERSRGELGRSLAAGRRAIDLTEAEPATMSRSWAAATLGWTLLDLRAGPEAAAVLERGLAARPGLAARFRLLGHLAWAHALTGDGPQAAAVATEAEQVYAALRVPEGDAYLFGYGAAANLVRAHLEAGHPERGQPLLAGLLAAAERTGWHEATALLALVLGRCAAARGQADVARAHLRRAVGLATEHGLPGVGWEARAALAPLAGAGEAEDLRAASAALVQRLAAGLTGDAALAAGFARAAEG